jgi:glutamate-1-semialdehyde 2,1-aminomutase
MDHLAPVGAVYQAGTLSGNPLATAAGLAALRQLGPDRYDELEARVAGFGPALHDAIAGAGLAVQVQVEGTLAGLFFSESPVRSYDDARAGDHQTYARFFHAMLDRGVFLAPSSYEVMFVSLAHTGADLARTVGRRRCRARVVSSAATNRLAPRSRFSPSSQAAGA